jgi:chorismate mutase/prephenate dehydratase
MDDDSSARDIGRHRAEIDRIDGEIVKLVGERAAHAAAIGQLKAGAPIYRPEREAEVLRRVARANPGPLPADSVTRIFVEVISACRALEGRIRVGYLGPEGTFSEMAVGKHFGGAIEAAPLGSIDEAFRQAETGATQFAVVPVENSTEGAIGRTLDLLLNTPLRICAEVVLRVHQNLMAKGDSTAGGAGDSSRGFTEGFSRVYSHAQSLAQCHQWLLRNLPQVERIQVSSNAEAARLAAGEIDACAIGPAIAAERYGLAILARNIEDEAQNMTRFLVLGSADPGPTGRDRTSLVMSAPNRPGAVHALIAPFARHGVSMSRIESRPARIGTWEYMFYLEIVGHEHDPAVAAALTELKGLAPFLKVLGSYPAAMP